jgi:hypothetical protein
MPRFALADSERREIARARFPILLDFMGGHVQRAK